MAFLEDPPSAVGWLEGNKKEEGKKARCEHQRIYIRRSLKQFSRLSILERNITECLYQANYNFACT